MSRVPPQGDFANARACSRFLGLNEDGSEVTCGKSPVVHIAWQDTPEGVEQGWACEDHREEALTRWEPLQHHGVGGSCGMPGSKWDLDNNRCFFDDENGIPVAEPVRAIAVPVERAA